MQPNSGRKLNVADISKDYFSKSKCHRKNQQSTVKFKEQWFYVKFGFYFEFNDTFFVKNRNIYQKLALLDLV